MSEPLPAGSPHPWHMVGAAGNTAWHSPVDHRAPVLTMGDRARNWRWQWTGHNVHSRATSYKRTSHLSEWASGQGEPSSAFRLLWSSRVSFFGLPFPHVQNGILPPNQETVTINELINESTYAVLDSAMTEPNPEEGVERLEYKGYPTALSLPGHRRLGWERCEERLGKL